MLALDGITNWDGWPTWAVVLYCFAALVLIMWLMPKVARLSRNIEQKVRDRLR